MNILRMVWKELWERPTAMLTSLATILLGVAALVAIRHVTVFSEREVSRQLSTLGANILVLPKNASLHDYYSADFNGQTLPEEYASQILLAGLPGVEKLSPRLCVPTQYNGRTVTVTGILPQQEFESKATWQTATVFRKKHTGCKKITCAPKPQDTSPEAVTTQRSIERLGEKEIIVGADLASSLHIKGGDAVDLLGGRFNVIATLPSTGTVDDSRIFAHLHTVQKLAKTGETVSAIEVLGCCEDAAGQLVPQLSQLLPDSRVVTISQVVQTQVGVNRLMAGASLCVVVVLVALGGTTVLGSISSNVRERRREIGTLMALGATPGHVARLFLLKASILGAVGGCAGSLIGVLLAIVAGPQWAGVRVTMIPSVVAIVCGGALLVAVTAAYWPARRASRLDPCTCFQEV